MARWFTKHGVKAFSDAFNTAMRTRAQRDYQNQMMGLQRELNTQRIDAADRRADQDRSERMEAARSKAMTDLAGAQQDFEKNNLELAKTIPGHLLPKWEDSALFKTGTAELERIDNRIAQRAGPNASIFGGKDDDIFFGDYPAEGGAGVGAGVGGGVGGGFQDPSFADPDIVYPGATQPTPGQQGIGESVGGAEGAIRSLFNNANLGITPYAGGAPSETLGGGPAAAPRLPEPVRSEDIYGRGTDIKTSERYEEEKSRLRREKFESGVFGDLIGSREERRALELAEGTGPIGRLHPLLKFDRDWKDLTPEEQRKVQADRDFLEKKRIEGGLTHEEEVNRTIEEFKRSLPYEQRFPKDERRGIEDIPTAGALGIRELGAEGGGQLLHLEGGGLLLPERDRDLLRGQSWTDAGSIEQKKLSANRYKNWPTLMKTLDPNKNPDPPYYIQSTGGTQDAASAITGDTKSDIPLDPLTGEKWPRGAWEIFRYLTNDEWMKPGGGDLNSRMWFAANIASEKLGAIKQQLVDKKMGHLARQSMGRGIDIPSIEGRQGIVGLETEDDALGRDVSQEMPVAGPDWKDFGPPTLSRSIEEQRVRKENQERRLREEQNLFLTQEPGYDPETGKRLFYQLNLMPKTTFTTGPSGFDLNPPEQRPDWVTGRSEFVPDVYWGDLPPITPPAKSVRTSASGQPVVEEVGDEIPQGEMAPQGKPAVSGPGSPSLILGDAARQAETSIAAAGDRSRLGKNPTMPYPVGADQNHGTIRIPIGEGKSRREQVYNHIYETEAKRLKREDEKWDFELRTAKNKMLGSEIDLANAQDTQKNRGVFQAAMFKSINELRVSNGLSPLAKGSLDGMTPDQLEKLFNVEIATAKSKGEDAERKAKLRGTANQKLTAYNMQLLKSIEDKTGGAIAQLQTIIMEKWKAQGGAADAPLSVILKNVDLPQDLISQFLGQYVGQFNTLVNRGLSKEEKGIVGFLNPDGTIDNAKIVNHAVQLWTGAFGAAGMDTSAWMDSFGVDKNGDLTVDASKIVSAAVPAEARNAVATRGQIAAADQNRVDTHSSTGKKILTPSSWKDLVKNMTPEAKEFYDAYISENKEEREERLGESYANGTSENNPDFAISGEYVRSLTYSLGRFFTGYESAPRNNNDLRQGLLKAGANFLVENYPDSSFAKSYSANPEGIKLNQQLYNSALAVGIVLVEKEFPDQGLDWEDVQKYLTTIPNPATMPGTIAQGARGLFGMEKGARYFPFLPSSWFD